VVSSRRGIGRFDAGQKHLTATDGVFCVPSRSSQIGARASF
jgi:hypothetical protein